MILAATRQRREIAMAGHFHAVVWIDHAKARIFHFNVDEADKTVIRPDHEVRDIHRGAKRTGHRAPEDRKYFEDVTQAIADAGAILIVGPGEEKHELAKFIAERHPAIEARIEGVESSDHPTDGELLDTARRYVRAADRMRP
jgi:stalled ribosome rescue protein Dom34